MPVLALNVPAYQPGLPHLYYFALSPEAEAAEAARHMWDQGHRQPLVFAPNNELGRRVATEFGQRWQQQSGRPAILAYFAGQSSIESDVRRALASAGTPPRPPPVLSSRSATAAGPAHRSPLIPSLWSPTPPKPGSYCLISTLCGTAGPPVCPPM
jgi:outer membrane PBP1 activator LpoA protein